MVCECLFELVWIVCSVGIGGILVIIGCYLCYCCLFIWLCLVELIGSVFVEGWCWYDCYVLVSWFIVIEGIGWFWVELGFVFEVVDCVLEVFDVVFIVVVWLLEELFGCCYGGLFGM